MIKLPRIITTPYKGAPLNKTKRRIHAAQADSQGSTAVSAGERRGVDRRLKDREAYIMERRTCKDRRRGRINLSV